MDLMSGLTVRRIADYRNELGDYYSNRTFCLSVWVIMGIQKLMILQQYTKRF